MTAPIITDRVIAFLPKTTGGIPPSIESSLANVCHEQGLTVLYADNILFACNLIEGRSELANTGSLVLDVLAGTAAAGRPLDRLGTLSSWSSRHAFLEQEAQLYNLFELSSESLRLESDPLGLKPLHFADVSGGRLLFSKVLDGLRVHPDLIRPIDPLAINQLMTSRATIPDRTVHERIRRTQTGTTLSYDPSRGTIWRRDRRLRPPPVQETVLADEVFEENERALSDSILAKTENLRQPLYMALSGGFDSRILAAHCAQLNLALQAICYGNKYHSELKNAKDVSAILGIDFRTIDYDSDNSIRSLPVHLSAVEATADLSTIGSVQLLRCDPPAGSGLLNGFAGDPLAGSTVSQLPPAAYKSAEDLASAITSLRAGAAVDDQRLFGHEVDEGLLVEETLNELNRDAELHQSFQYWNFENRQRRYTASSFLVTGASFDLILPFLDRRVIDLWARLPPVALDNRNLFRRLLAQRHPKLARIPHPEERGKPIVPNLEYQLKSLLRHIPSKLLTTLFGDETARKVLAGLGRVDYIWSLGNLASPRHQRHMIRRINELRPVASEVLGLSISADFADQTRGNIQARRTLFMLCEYALHLGEELGRQ